MESDPKSSQNNESKKDSLCKLIIRFFKNKKNYFASRLRNIIIKCYNIGVIGLEQKNYD